MTKQPAKKSRKPKQVNKIWAKSYYIRGFGRVEVGDVASAASLEAFRAISKSEPKLKDVEHNTTEQED